jgi:hypothetical protein
MIWIQDKHKNILFSNKALQESLKNINMFEMLECSEIPTEQKTFVKKMNVNDKEVYLEISLTPLFDEDDEDVVGCSGVVKDVTDTIIRQGKIIEKLTTLETTTKNNTKEALRALSNTMSNFGKGWVNDR